MAAENLPAHSTDVADPARRPVRDASADPAVRRPGRSSGQARLPRFGSRPARKLLIGSIVVAYAWVASASAPFSTRALIGVLIPGAVLGAIAYGRPPERIPAPDSIDMTGFSYWIIALALLFEWEASAFQDGAPWWHPTLTDVINPLLVPHPVRSVAFVAWLASGWALVRR
jgi:hypothetical protein